MESCTGSACAPIQVEPVDIRLSQASAMLHTRVLPSTPMVSRCVHAVHVQLSSPLPQHKLLPSLLSQHNAVLSFHGLCGRFFFAENINIRNTIREACGLEARSYASNRMLVSRGKTRISDLDHTRVLRTHCGGNAVL